MTDSVFTSAVTAFTQLVRDLPEHCWDGPGLGDWDMRALVGHTSRSLITVSEYLRTPADREDVTDAAAYYVRIREYAGTAGSEAITERGRAAGRDLGTDPVAAIDGLAARALTDVRTAGDPVITVIGGMGIRLSNYLQTRVFELAVHGLDIARAAGREFALPPEVSEQATVLAARVAVRLGQGQTVLSALTGRSALPSDFSVV